MKIKDKLDFEDFLEIEREVHKFALKGKKAIVAVYEHKELLSENQRRYYFGVVVKACQQSEQWGGYTREDIHKELKVLYLPEYSLFLKELSAEQDVTIMMQKFLSVYHDLTITTQKRGQFEGYMSRIRMGEAKKGIYIPLPNEGNWWEGAELIK